LNRAISMFGLAALSGVPLATSSAALADDDRAERMSELSRMSLEELANVEVTSVSRATQRLSSAAATIYVITGEEIARSGVTSIPEALRLAPNLLVTQINAQEYQVSSRGFNANLELQAFSNKILILIDGRSVYNPLFSGVAYDAQDVFMDDIDRIEIISGPGATLWGANAMNGVINIITRSAHATTGAVVRAGSGNQESAASGRYGGTFGDDNAFRIYAKGFDRGPSELADGGSAGDRWHKAMAGFRIDLGTDATDRFTFQGDYQDATENQGALGDVGFSQMDVLGRWVRQVDDTETRLQIFFDQTDRDQPPSGVGFALDTFDLDFQQTRSIADRHRVVWGVGRRHNDYEIVNTQPLAFVPPRRTLRITNVFAQETLSLGTRVEFTAGIKFEENSYSGWSTLPDLRVSWATSERGLLWAAAARAIRAPTPFDVDVEERVGETLFIEGHPNFRTEKVDAFEIGYRAQRSASFSWSVTAFSNDYDDLRSIEPAATFLPLRWDNLLEGHTYGVEFWANVQLTSWWRLSPGVRTVRKELSFSNGASGLLGTAQAGNDPDFSVQLKSTWAFRRVSVDAMLRHVDELPSPANPAYTELSARVAWRASESLEFSLSGLNLLDERHSEYTLPTARAIPRSVFAEARWMF
jgi:iron complex outermembrane receptor protein